MPSIAQRVIASTHSQAEPIQKIITSKLDQADAGNRYWYNQLQKDGSDQARQLMIQFDPSKCVGKIYKTYYQQGKKFPDEMASNVNEIMGVIRSLAKDDSGKSAKTVEVDQKMFFAKDTPKKDIVNVYATGLMQYKGMYGDDKKPDSLTRMLSIPEVDIKTIAVSIMAETGDVKLAREVLSVVGTQIIAGMNSNEMKTLKADLQSISTQTNPDISNYER